jgi:hypothetical protein
MLVNFSELPENARVWIYQASRIMNDVEQTLLQKELHQFISTWTAHQAGLKGGAEIHKGIFVVISVDENHNHASGCSIDKSVHFMKQIGEKLGINFFDRLTAVCQNPNGEMIFVNARNVNELLHSGRLSIDAYLFNNLINFKGSMDTFWRTPLSQSWISNFIQSASTSSTS